MRLSILLITFLMVACNAQKALNQNAKNSDNGEITENKLAAATECIKNSTETMELCISESQSNPSQPRNTISFAVTKLEDSSIIYESSIDGGHVKWYDDQRLEIFTIPGYMRQDQTNDDYTKIYDLKTEELISKKAFLDR